MSRFSILIILLILAAACAPATVPSANVQLPGAARQTGEIPAGFAEADGSRPLTFPEDFGAHDDFLAEWWYYTGNLETAEGRHFGFELTIFRGGMVSPTTELPTDSQWYNHSLYFAHFAISDIAGEQFYAFERYSRQGPGLAGAQAKPYRVWIEDWSISEQTPGVYQLQAAQENIALNLTLTDEMGVVLHGENGYSRKGERPSNASYYYSQPRLRADGFVQVDNVKYPVHGLVWKDHEFSTSALEENQIGWDWFSLQLENGAALMLYQLRERDGNISEASSGTFITAQGVPRPIQKDEFTIVVGAEWQSPHTQGVYPAAWNIQLAESDCLLQVQPWMSDQEIRFRAATYWEGAVHFAGTCNGVPVRGNGYVELTGYAGSLPLPSEKQ